MSFGTRLFKKRTIIDLTIWPEIRKIIKKNKSLRKKTAKKTKVK